MTKIVFIRHGETKWNAMGMIQGITDTDLNEKGREQAKLCGRYLSRENWDLLITSPLCRAKETSMIISHFMDVNVKVMDEFAEKDYGEAVGFSLEQQDKYEAFGETSNLLKNRIMKGIERIIANPTNQKVLLVTHGDVIQTFITTLFHMDIISHAGNLPIKNASITAIEYAEKRWILHSLNQTDHLS